MKQSPVLILHGWGIKKELYQLLVDKLRQKGSVVYLPELPGFGSNRVMRRPLNLIDYTEFIKEFLRKNKIQKPIVVGHSFGGRIAILLAAENREIFSKMVLTGVPVFSPVSSFKVQIFKILARVGKAYFRLPILVNLSPFFRKLLYFLAGSFDYYKLSGYLRETFKNVISFNLEKFLPKIEVETLIVWGKKDKVTPVWIAKKIHQGIRNSKLILINDGAHNLIYEKPDIFLKYVFL